MAEDDLDEDDLESLLSPECCVRGLCVSPASSLSPLIRSASLCEARWLFLISLSSSPALLPIPKGAHASHFSFLSLTLLNCKEGRTLPGVEGFYEDHKRQATEVHLRPRNSRPFFSR